MTTTRLVIPLFLTALCVAQDLPTDDALRAAIAIEEFEHDDVTARARFQALANSTQVPDPVRRHASLRLAMLARRQGDAATAAAAFDAAAKGDDLVAARAQDVREEQTQDPERARQLDAAAEKAVTTWVEDEKIDDEPALAVEVVWFGEAAVRPLIRQFEAMHSRGQLSSAGRAARILWQIPAPSAREFLARQIRSDDATRVMSVFVGSSQASVDKAELLRDALRDPRGPVVQAALDAAGVLTIDDVAPLVTDPRPEVRRRALKALHPALVKLQSASPPPGNSSWTELSDRLAPRLAQALDSIARDEAMAAAEALAETAMWSTAGRRLLASRLAGFPPIQISRPQASLIFDGDAECAELVAQAATSLATEKVESPRWAMAQFVGVMTDNKAWKRAALEPLLRIAKHGFLDEHLTSWLFENALPEDATRVIAALTDCESLCAASTWLAQVPQRATDFEPLLHTYRSLRANGSSRNWRIEALLVPIARTGRAEVLTLLDELREETNPSFPREWLVEAAMWHAQLVRTESTRALLRELLDEATRSSARPEGDNELRLFGQLVRLGDMDIWTRYGALAPRLAGQSTVVAARLPDSGGQPANSTVGIDDWLTYVTGTGADLRWWHGYDEAQLLAVWTLLLAPRDGKYWQQVWIRSGALGFAGNAGAPPVSTALYVKLCDAYRERCAADPRFDPSGTALLPLLWASSQPQSDPARGKALAALRYAVAEAQSDAVRDSFVFGLELPLSEADLAQVRKMVGDRSEGVARRAWNKLTEQEIPIDRALISTAIASPSDSTREAALEFASRAIEPVTDLIIPMLNDSAAPVRILACRFLAAKVDYQSVPALLETLKDPEEDVRRTAAESLQAIRLYHDEKARWARVLGGKPEIGTAAAAEALCDRARAGNDKDTRLLAIRALGDLGAAEPLALLIDWTKDADSDIARTAREAIAAIHMKSK